MTKMLSRRDVIEAKIMAKSVIVHLGFILNGKRSPCHIWQGGTSGTGRGGGYGRMSLNSHTVAVHIVRFCNHFGFIPGNKHIDHLCNNRLCSNPKHLEMVSPKKNQQRRVKRAKDA